MNHKASEFSKNYLQYQLLVQLGNHSSDKRMRIDTFLISHISQQTNSFIFSKKKLMKRFHCSMITVNRAIHILKKIPDYRITGNCIQYAHDFREGL